LQVLASYFRRILANPRLPPTLLAAAKKDGGEEENVHRERQRRWVKKFIEK
jgi:hypothetical protein